MTDETTNRDGGPAFPGTTSAPNASGVMYQAHHQGMTLRAYAAIQLRTPDSGIEWLDSMIRKSLLDQFAGQAMAAFLTKLMAGQADYCDVALWAYLQAEEMLVERYDVHSSGSVIDKLTDEHKTWTGAD